MTRAVRMREARNRMLQVYGDVAALQVDLEASKYPTAFTQASIALSDLGRAAGALLELIEVLEKGEKDGRS